MRDESVEGLTQRRLAAPVAAVIAVNSPECIWTLAFRNTGSSLPGYRNVRSSTEIVFGELIGI